MYDVAYFGCFRLVRVRLEFGFLFGLVNLPSLVWLDLAGKRKGRNRQTDKQRQAETETDRHRT